MSLSKWEKKRNYGCGCHSVRFFADRNLTGNSGSAFRQLDLTIVGTRRIRGLICRLLTAGFCLRFV